MDGEIGASKPDPGAQIPIELALSEKTWNEPMQRTKMPFAGDNPRFVEMDPETGLPRRGGEVSARWRRGEAAAGEFLAAVGRSAQAFREEGRVDEIEKT